MQPITLRVLDPTGSTLTVRVDERTLIALGRLYAGLLTFEQAWLAINQEIVPMKLARERIWYLRRAMRVQAGFPADNFAPQISLSTTRLTSRLFPPN